MNPRAEPCDETAEDQIIWAEVVFRLGRVHSMLGSVLWTRSLMQDRRDSSLMWSMIGVVARYGYTIQTRHVVLAHYFAELFRGLLP